MSRSSPALPRAARRYLLLVQFAGAAAAAASLWALGQMVWRPEEVGEAFLLGAALVVMQVKPLTLVWRGQRLGVHADEGVIALGLVLVPTPLVILAATVATVVGQVWQRKSMTKVSFNSAAQLVSTCAGALAYVVAVQAGLGTIVAVLLVPLVVSVVNQVVVAILLAFLAEDGWTGAFRPTLALSVTIATVTGSALGLISLALLKLHPIALIILLPAWALLHRGMGWAYHRENELEARRTLNQVATSLLRHSDERAIVAEVMRGCQAAFAPLECGFTRGGPTQARPLASAPQTGVLRIAEPILDGSGAVIGELWATFGRGASADALRSQGLLVILANHLSLALVNARAAASLEASEKRMRDAFDAAADPILVVDEELGILFENAASRRVLGSAGLAPALSVASRDALLHKLGSDAIGKVELEITSANGEARLLEASTSLFRLPEGLGAFLLMTQDITENRRLEAEAARQRVALARAERLSAVGTLVEGVAHEINNPLMYLNASLDFALMDVEEIAGALHSAGVSLDGVDLESTKDRLMAVRKGADRIGQITGALGFIVEGTGKAGKLVPLGEMLTGLGPILAAALPEGVHLDVAPVADGTGLAVPTELGQALIEVTTNAIEALQESGGTVRIRHSCDETHVTVIVEDDGPGMSPGVQAKLFTPFFTTKVERVGLGLARAMSIVVNLGGTIQADAREGAGARFELTVPRETPEEARAREAASTGEVVGRHGNGRSFSIGRKRR